MSPRLAIFNGCLGPWVDGPRSSANRGWGRGHLGIGGSRRRALPLPVAVTVSSGRVRVGRLAKGPFELKLPLACC